METKKIKQAINTGKRFGGGKRWVELIVLYTDGTWEKIFEYRWDGPDNQNLYNAGRFTGRTRDEAIIMLEKAYYNGDIEGVFID